MIWDSSAAGLLLLSGAETPSVASWQPRPARPVFAPHRPIARTAMPWLPPVVVPPAASWFPVRVGVMPRRDPAMHPRGRVVRPPLVIADSSTPPVGPAGAASFAINVEDGATITYEWPSTVRKMWSGKETRASLARTPRQRFDFSSLLTDTQMRTILGTLGGDVGDSIDAPTYLLGLPHEELGVVSSTASSIVVQSLALCDWAAPGQRLLVVGLDGVTVASTWIDGAPSGATIPVGSDVSATAQPGARVMPAIAVKLESEQGFTRHRVGVMRWDLVANAAQAGFGASTTWGTGATVATHDSIPVWDRGNVTSQASQPLRAGYLSVDAVTDLADAVDFRTTPDWSRALRIESADAPDTEWQWFKAFLMLVRGRARAFLLPTGRPDLVAIGDASGGTIVVSGTDYTADWFPSLAHRRLRIVFTDGTFAYRTVTGSVDNGNGTHTLTLTSAAAGTIDRVEFLELVRLDSDEVKVTWSGYSFESSLTAQVVQQ